MVPVPVDNGTNASSSTGFAMASSTAALGAAGAPFTNHQYPSISSTAVVPVAPFHTPGHSIYVSDPRRFSVLSLSIDYATRISSETSSSCSITSSGFTNKDSLLSEGSSSNTPSTSNPSIAHDASTPTHTGISSPTKRPPPANSVNASSSSNTGGSTLSNFAARARRISFGKRHASNGSISASGTGAGAGSSTSTVTGPSSSAQAGGKAVGKAREAWHELGRAARGAADRIAGAASNTGGGGDNSSIAFPSSQASASGAGTASTSAEAPPPSSTSLSAALGMASGRSIDSRHANAVSASIEITVRPRSMTYGRDRSLADPEVPLDISARSYVGAGTGRDARTEMDSSYGGDPKIEFCLDSEPLVAESSLRATKGGVHSPATRPSSVASSDSEIPTLSGPASSYMNYRKPALQVQPFDANRLLLKVRPPQKAARRMWRKAGHSTTLDDNREAGQVRSLVAEENEIRMTFRLRTQGQGKTCFLAAESSQKLYDAVSHLSNRDVENANALLLGSQVIEGAQGSGPRDSEVEWALAVPSESAEKRDDALFAESDGMKVATCFVEEAANGKMIVVSAFSFLANRPSTPSEDTSIIPASKANGEVKSSQGKAAGRSGTSPSPRLLHASLGPDAPSIVAALSSDEYINNSPVLGKHARRMSRRSTSAGSSAQVSPAMSNKLELMNTGVQAVDAGDIDKTLTPEDGSALFATTEDARGVRSARLDINHTDISLEDAEEDSPVFRAAIAGLEKRTANVKKACKTLLKVWQETRAQQQLADASEKQLAEALDEMISLAPNTLGSLQNVLLAPAREKDLKRSKERIEMLDKYLEAPLMRLLDLCRGAQDQIKLFESESKLYYASMQKWMSTRGSTTPSAAITAAANAAQSASADQATGTMLKADISAEKQQLRSLAFARARVEMFAVMSKLHGGQAELDFFKEIMNFAAWCAESPTRTWGNRWPSESARTTLASLHAGTQQALAQTTAMEETLVARLADIESRMSELEEYTKVAQAEALVAGAQTEGAKAPAQRIKSLLTSLGISSPNQPATSPQPESSASGQGQGDPAATPAQTASKTLSNLRRKVSMKLNMTSGTTASAPGSAVPNGPMSPMSQALSRWKQREEVASSKTLGVTLASLGSVSAASPASVTTPLKTPSRPTATPQGGFDGEDVTERFAGMTMASSPTLSRRANSVHSQRPSLSDAELRRTSTSRRRMSTEDGTASSRTTPYGLGISADDATLTNPPPSFPIKSSSRPSSGKERKKQGVLWVSKPINGSGGADAPRGVKMGFSWHEAWVVLSGSGHLGEYADWKDAKILEPSAPIIDLRFATVREARGLDRRFTFEVVTRDSRRFFQAADETSFKEWTSAISKAIESLIDGTSSVRQVDKVAKVNQRWTGNEYPALVEGDEFGAKDRPTSMGGIASSNRFSQSLTDLTSSSSAKFLHWGAEAAAGLRSKRDSKVLSMVDESDPDRQGLPISHERGISNKTPLSGYVGQHARRGPTEASENGISAVSDPDNAFDKRIEEMVQSHYGGVSAADIRRQSAPPGGLNRQVSAGRTKEARAAEISRISKQPENSICADCRTREPRWAAWALNGKPCCIFICIECSGVHRSLGVQVSKVKSVDLDDWTEEQLEAARKWGNLNANAYWEYSRPASAILSRDNQSFWLQKYREKAWCPPQTLEEFLASSQQRKRDSISSISSGIGLGLDTTPIRSDASPSRRSSGSGLRRSVTEYDGRAFRQRPASPLRRSTEYTPVRRSIEQEARTPLRPVSYVSNNASPHNPHNRSASTSLLGR